jgi:hypothetical protein
MHVGGPHPAGYVTLDVLPWDGRTAVSVATSRRRSEWPFRTEREGEGGVVFEVVVVVVVVVAAAAAVVAWLVVSDGGGIPVRADIQLENILLLVVVVVVVDEVVVAVDVVVFAVAAAAAA